MTTPSSAATRYIDRQTARALIEEVQREVRNNSTISSATRRSWSDRLGKVLRLLIGDQEAP